MFGLAAVNFSMSADESSLEVHECGFEENQSNEEVHSHIRPAEDATKDDEAPCNSFQGSISAHEGSVACNSDESANDWEDEGDDEGPPEMPLLSDLRYDENCFGSILHDRLVLCKEGSVELLHGDDEEDDGYDGADDSKGNQSMSNSGSDETPDRKDRKRIRGSEHTTQSAHSGSFHREDDGARKERSNQTEEE